MDFFASENFMKYFARILVVFTTLPAHEFAHAWTAHLLGDDTAAEQDRLTLNPFAHVDWRGALLLLITGFGWARPVPVNPGRFRKMSPRVGMAVTAAAGPFANLVLALILLLAFKGCYIGAAMNPSAQAMLGTLAEVCATMVLLNLSLAVFNLLPVPPLDGYNVLSIFLPRRVIGLIERHQEAIFPIMLLVLWFTPLLDAPIGWMSNHMLNGLDWLSGAVLAPFMGMPN